MSIEPLAVRRKTAAAMIGLGKTKLDELMGAGEIVAVKSGKALLIPVAELRRYLVSLPNRGAGATAETRAITAQIRRFPLPTCLVFACRPALPAWDGARITLQ